MPPKFLNLLQQTGQAAEASAPALLATPTSRLLLRPLALLMFAILTVALMSGCGQVSFTAEQHYLRALEHQQTGDMTSALVEFKNALQRDPEHAGARLGLGVVSLEMGDLAAARTELQRAESLGVDRTEVLLPLARIWLLEGESDRILEQINPGDFESDTELAEALVLRAGALTQLGEPARAMETLDEALHVAPDLALAHIGIAGVYRSQGMLTEARASLRSALEMDSGLHQAWSFLGELELADGQPRAAEAAFSQAIELAPRPHGLHLQRAITRFVLQDTAGMQEDVGALRRLLPGTPATAYARGLLLYLQERYADAQTAFEEALAGQPSLDQATFFLGATHLAQGRWRAAEQHLSRFLNAYPESDTAARMLAQARLGEGSPQAAATLLEAVLGRNPEDAGTLQTLASLQLSLGETDLAIGHLRQLAAVRPHDPAARVALARGLLDAGQREEGLRELETALGIAPDRLDIEQVYVYSLIQARQVDAAIEAALRLKDRQPENTISYNLLAAAQMLRDDRTAARATLEQGLGVAPGDPELSSNLAQVWLREGNTQEARRALRESLEQNPGHPTVAIRLARLELGAGDFDAARAVLLESIEENPDVLETRTLLAEQHLLRNEPRSALTALGPVRESAATDPRVLNLLGQAQSAAGQRAQAVSTFRLLADRIPDTPQNRHQLGRQFEQAGSARDAVNQYRRALELDETHPETLRTWAVLELREGRPEEALRLARRLQQHEGSVAAGGFVIEGAVHARAERNEAALTAYARAYELDPSVSNAMALAQAQLGVGQAQQAATTLTDHLEQRPDDNLVRFRLAEILIQLDRFDAAIEQYEDLVGLFPENVTILNNLAYLYQEQDDPRALEYAERAYAVGPENPAVSGTLGWILVNRGDLQRGLPLLEVARAGLPDDPDLSYRYAAALVKADRPEAARDQLGALLAAERDFRNRSNAENLLETLR